MTMCTAIEQLLEVEETQGEGIYSRETLCVAMARIGADTQRIVAGRMQDVAGVELGPPLHSLVIVGSKHLVEEEFLAQFLL